MSQVKTRPSRRHFLLAAGAGGAASAAAMVAAVVPQTPLPTASAIDKRKTKGYHASEHIRNYYETTKV